MKPVMKRVRLSRVRAGRPASAIGVAAYRAAIRAGQTLRPLRVIQESRPTRYRVLDGFHRYRAMHLEKVTHAFVIVAEYEAGAYIGKREAA